MLLPADVEFAAEPMLGASQRRRRTSPRAIRRVGTDELLRRDRLVDRQHGRQRVDLDLHELLGSGARRRAIRRRWRRSAGRESGTISRASNSSSWNTGPNQILRHVGRRQNRQRCHLTFAPASTSIAINAPMRHRAADEIDNEFAADRRQVVDVRRRRREHARGPNRAAAVGRSHSRAPPPPASRRRKTFAARFRTVAAENRREPRTSVIGVTSARGDLLRPRRKVVSSKGLPGRNASVCGNRTTVGATPA